MNHLSVSELKTHTAAVLDMAQREPVTIQKKGRSVAVILSLSEYEKVTQYLAEYKKRRFLDLCDEIRKEASDNGLTQEILDDILRDDKEDAING